MLTGLSAMKSDNFILKAIFGPVLEVLLLRWPGGRFIAKA
jgi:hypothetical protein